MAQHVAAGKSKSAAARAAGFKSFANQGHRVCKEPDVINRIEELTQAYSKEAEEKPGASFKSEAFILVELAEIHNKAKREGQLPVCINALGLLARIGKLDGSGSSGRGSVRTTNNVIINVNELNTTLKSQLSEVSPAERRRLLEQNPELSALMSGDVIDVEAEPIEGE